MKSPHRTPVVLAILVFFLVFQGGQITGSAKDTWTSVKSRNFSLVGNASEREIREVATRLEQFREVFSQLFPRLKLASPIPTTVIVFKSDSSFKPYKPVADGKTNTNVAGYFQPGRAVNYIALSAEERSEDSYRTIFHEYVHLLVNNTLGRAGVPAWFNEGLAEYYSTFAIEDARKVSLGKLIPNHLYLLRSTKPLPLETLFAVDYHSLHRNKRDTVGLFYAQSWALVHYLIQGNEGKNLTRMGAFLELVITNNDARTSFNKAFQTDYAGMEKELKAYIQRGTYRMNVATFAKKLEFDAEMKVAPLSEAEGLAYLGDLLVHTQRPAEAKTKLEQSLAMDPTIAMAHASMGMALMEEKNYPAAKVHLAKAVAGNSSDYLAHYYYAYILSREGMDEDMRIDGYGTEAEGIMRTQLRKAIELKPDFAESYHLLAFINLVTDTDLNDAVQLINKAIALSPGSEEYLFVLTQIHMRKRDFTAASRIIEPLATNASDPGIRATAQGLMKMLKDYQENLARYEREKANYESQRRSSNESVTAPPPASQPQTDPFAYLGEALRKPESGESRAQGILTRLECSPNKIVFWIKQGDALLRLSSKGFEGIDITSYTSEVGGELTCGPRKGDELVVVTYKELKDARTKTDGAIVAIEFVPKGFTLPN